MECMPFKPKPRKTMRKLPLKQERDPRGRIQQNTDGSFGKKVGLSVSRLEAARKKRKFGARKTGIGIALTTASGAGAIAHYNNGQPLRTIMVAGITAAFAYAAGAGGIHLANNRKVREATRNVGRELGRRIQESDKKGNQIHNFLQKYRYVYINRKGELVGTNRPRILAGRMRLESKKILNQEY
jgi:hypothetical protein